MLECVEVETGADPVGSVIWLHGLGADGHDFEPVVPELRLPTALPLRFIFPHAPVRPVTLNGGLAMRAWFDILALDKSGPVDEPGIRESVGAVESIVAREIERGVAPAEILVAGFSQGGVIATYLALTYPSRMAGLMALSTYLPMPASLATEQHEAARKLPVFAAHGIQDQVLPLSLGRDLRDWLGNSNVTLTWQEYQMAHAVCPEEIAAIRSFMLDVFAVS